MKYELTPRQVEVARFALYMFARNARLRADAAAQKSSEEPFSNVAAFLKDAADAEELIGHLAAAPTTAATPAGMMLVPVEPTPEMLRDAQEACGMLGPILPGRVWSAMLAAAPKVAAEDLAVQASAEAHAKPLVPPNLALAEALEEYWDAAWQEGREDRHHDTEDGRAQKALMAVYSAIYAAQPQPKGTEPVGHFIEDFGGEKGRWQQCKEAAHYTAPLFREPAQAPAPAPEPVAMRYDFDGYGWKYIDNGSGSDWMTRHPDGELLYDGPCAAVGAWQLHVPVQHTTSKQDGEN